MLQEAATHQNVAKTQHGTALSTQEELTGCPRAHEQCLPTPEKGGIQFKGFSFFTCTYTQPYVSACMCGPPAVSALATPETPSGPKTYFMILKSYSFLPFCPPCTHCDYT